jgi:hypothetical protein
LILNCSREAYLPGGTPTTHSLDILDEETMRTLNDVLDERRMMKVKIVKDYREYMKGCKVKHPHDKNIFTVIAAMMRLVKI